MARINLPAAIEDAPEGAQPLLNAVKAKLGVAPNLYKLIGASPAGLAGTLELTGRLAEGALNAKFRELIALTVANVNGCSYCNSAHTFIGRNLKLTDEEIALAREGRSNDPKIEAGLSFARLITLSRGDVSERDVQAARAAGYSDAELVEIVLNVALNVLTNYVNEVFKTDIDFPRVDAARAA